jgi:hypothetical protein
MLYFIGVWTILLLICGVIGTALLQTFRASIERLGDRFFLAIWLGLIVLSVALLATSIVLPLSPIVGLAIAVLLGSAALLNPQTRTQLIDVQSQFSRTRFVGLLGVMIVVAAISSQAVTWIDTGLYHYSVIRWLADFGAVPGVALLLPNFGFTSTWFALAAPLNAEFLGDRASVVTNGFIFLVAVLQFLLSLVRSFQFRARQSVLFLTDIVAWAILLQEDGHRSTDAYSTPASPYKQDTAMISLILAAGTVTIKLIALPLLIVTSLLFIVKQLAMKQRFRRLLTGGIVLCALLSPPLVHSLITSGCPLFPSSLFCLDVPWSPKPSVIQGVTKATQQWITWYGTPPAGVHPWLWGIIQWFTSERLNQVVALLILVSVVSAIYVTIAAVKLKKLELLRIVAIAFSGISFIMLTAPFLRFGLGYLVLTPALATAIYCDRNDKTFLSPLQQQFILWKQHKTSRNIPFAAALFLVSAITVTQLQGDYSRVLLPPPLPKVRTIQRQVNNVTYYSPSADKLWGTELCWATQLPCALTVKNTRLRDPERGIRAGFIRDDGAK